MTDTKTGDDSERSQASNPHRAKLGDGPPSESIQGDAALSRFELLRGLRVWNPDGTPVTLGSLMVQHGLVVVYGKTTSNDGVSAEIALMDEQLAPGLWLSLILPETFDLESLPAPLAHRTRCFLDNDNLAASQLNLSAARVAFAVYPGSRVVEKLTDEHGIFLLERNVSLLSEGGTDRMIDLGDVVL